MVQFVSRRSVIKQCASGLLGAAILPAAMAGASQDEERKAARQRIAVRGIYGGFPDALFDRGQSPADFGVNAIWVGSGGLNSERIDRYHKAGAKVFAEFNSMHAAEFLKENPDAAPIGPDGKPSPPPSGWQGVSPFHPG